MDILLAKRDIEQATQVSRNTIKAHLKKLPELRQGTGCALHSEEVTPYKISFNFHTTS